MTTVVYKNGQMACDTRLTAGDEIVPGTTDKIYPVGVDKGLMGMAGNANCTFFTQDLFDSIKSSDDLHEQLASVPTTGNDLYEMLVVFASEPSKIWYVQISAENTFDMWSVDLNEEESFAIGSGRKYAMAAVSAGVGIVEAIEVAMQHDTGTGGEIYVYDL